LCVHGTTHASYRMPERHRLSKFCAYATGGRCRRAPGRLSGTKRLGEQRFPFATQQITFDSYPHSTSSTLRSSSWCERSGRWPLRSRRARSWLACVAFPESNSHVCRLLAESVLARA
jgi:hypothetical protein